MTGFTLCTFSSFIVTFEMNWTLSIECTDDGGEEGTSQVKVTITDANENPSVTAMTLTVEENAPSELQLAKGTTVTIEDHKIFTRKQDHPVQHTIQTVMEHMITR